MVAKIQIINQIHGFFIVLNSKKARIDAKIQEMFKFLKEIFPNFITNLAVIFTNWNEINSEKEEDKA